MNWQGITLFLVAIVLSTVSFCQHLSAGGGFEVDEIKGCAPHTVTVSLIPPFICDTNNPCAAFYENMTTSVPLIVPPFTHTYTEPGIYYLRILRHPVLDSIRIEVVPNVAPGFNLYTCGNNEISVQLDDSHYDEYVIDYNDASPEIVVGGTGADHHVYAAGTQTVSVRGRNLTAADNCSADNRTITPLLTLPVPTITRLEVPDNSSIQLDFDVSPDIQYKLGIATNNATTFQQLSDVYNSSAFTVQNLNTDNNYYCFRLAAFDPCNNISFNSAVICSADLDLNIRNKAIDVTWTTSPTGISDYSLQRAAGDGSTLVTSPPASPHTDTGVLCGIEYCYQLTTRYTNGSESVSMTKCGTGFSDDTPTAIRNVTAVVSDDGVALEWQSDPNFVPVEFIVEKSTNGSYSQLATTTQHTFEDPSYATEDASCYRIRYHDACANESLPGIEACPIRLAGTLAGDNTVNLTWSPYGGWENGVTDYVVEKYSSEGTLLQTTSTGTTTAFTDATSDLNHQALVYIVRALAVEGGLNPSLSNQIAILKDPNLFHPTAFTPNGDNLNDVFTVFGQYVVDFEMHIFNRWGELLFTTNDITTGWDGTYKGNDMPEGTYAFIANITDRTGRIFKRSGSVVLLRR